MILGAGHRFSTEIVLSLKLVSDFLEQISYVKLKIYLDGFRTAKIPGRETTISE